MGEFMNGKNTGIAMIKVGNEYKLKSYFNNTALSEIKDKKISSDISKKALSLIHI